MHFFNQGFREAASAAYIETRSESSGWTVPVIIMELNSTYFVWFLTDPLRPRRGCLQHVFLYGLNITIHLYYVRF